MKAIIEYDELAPEDRPQDDSQTGEDWKFETLEHDEMARAINIKWIEFNPNPEG